MCVGVDVTGDESLEMSDVILHINKNPPVSWNQCLLRQKLRAVGIYLKESG